MKSIEQRLKWYITLYKTNPESLAAPKANITGILCNVLGYTNQQVKDYLKWNT